MRIHSSHLVVWAVVLWSGLVMIATGQQPPANPEGRKLKNPAAATSESVAAGKQLYQKYCRFCHGAAAKGNSPMAPEGTQQSDLTDEKWQGAMSDGEIFVTIRDGVPPKFDMKGFKSKLTDQEMWNIVNYLRSLGPTAKSH